MCVVCGCSNSQPLSASGSAHGHDGHAHDALHDHEHSHEHGLDYVYSQPQVDVQQGDLNFAAGAARVTVPGMSQGRAIKLEADILAANKRIAQQNRRHFQAHGVTALNLVSSPGSGKTTLLCATINALRKQDGVRDVAVIEGDQQTSLDAQRIRATGAPAVQVNTGKGCHLDASMVAQAFEQLHLRMHHHAHHGHDPEPSLLFIENVGNLVCPSMWDLGEAAKVVVLSVTEGEDKPLKYPDMFAAARLMLLNKSDLLPYLEFDVQRCIAAARQVNPNIDVIELSATTGTGMTQWLDWLLAQASAAPKVAAVATSMAEPAAAGTDATLAALRTRVAELEHALAKAQRLAQP